MRVEVLRDPPAKVPASYAPSAPAMLRPTEQDGTLSSTPRGRPVQQWLARRTRRRRQAAGAAEEKMAAAIWPRPVAGPGRGRPLFAPVRRRTIAIEARSWTAESRRACSAASHSKSCAVSQATRRCGSAEDRGEHAANARRCSHAATCTSNTDLARAMRRAAWLGDRVQDRRCAAANAAGRTGWMMLNPPTRAHEPKGSRGGEH